MQIYGPSQLHGAQQIHAPHATRAAEPSTASASAPISDRLDISEAGQIASRMAELPDVRAERVASIRAAIAEGTYETADRLSSAVERLLDEIA